MTGMVKKVSGARIPCKQAKMKKSPFAPKRFKSAYMFFSTAKHKEIRSQTDKKILTTQVAKLVSEAWKSLSVEERAKWEEVARRDKIRYNAEKNSYRGPWKVPAGAFRAKATDAPRRPLSAILAFSNERRGELRRKHPNWDNAEIAAQLSCMWKSLADDERQFYVDREKRLRETYKEEMVLWKQKLQIEKEILQCVDFSDDDHDESYSLESEQDNPLEQISPDMFVVQDEEACAYVDEPKTGVSVIKSFPNDVPLQDEEMKFDLELENRKIVELTFPKSERWSDCEEQKQRSSSLCQDNSPPSKLENGLLEGCPSTPLSSRQSTIIPIVSPSNSKDCADEIASSSLISAEYTLPCATQNSNLSYSLRSVKKCEPGPHRRPETNAVGQRELIAASLQPIRISAQGEIMFPEQKPLRCVGVNMVFKNMSSHAQDTIDAPGIHNYFYKTIGSHNSMSSACNCRYCAPVTSTMTSFNSMTRKPHHFSQPFNPDCSKSPYNSNPPSTSPSHSMYIQDTTASLLHH